jgi:hypothetical protein
MALTSWATHVLQWSVQSDAKLRSISKTRKADLSSDWSLKPDSMKVESLVIAYQHDAVNTFPGLVHTARHTTRVEITRSHWHNQQWSAVTKVGLVRGVKS